MANDGKFLTLESGQLKQEQAINSSAGAGDADKIIRLGADGRLSSTVLPAGIGPETRSITASEAISAGNLVNVWDSSGEKVRKADATTSGKEANGFVLAAISNGAAGTVYLEEAVISGLSGLTVGAIYYLATTAGAITSTPPSGSGNVVQQIGKALSATELLFRPQQPIILA